MYISYLLSCNELSQKLLAQTTNVYYPIIFEGQESGSGLAVGRWLEVSREVADRLSSRAAVSSDGWAEARSPLPGSAT